MRSARKPCSTTFVSRALSQSDCCSTIVPCILLCMWYAPSAYVSSNHQLVMVHLMSKSATCPGLCGEWWRLAPLQVVPLIF